jgi:7-carboxy-7-deazaguanine synthase
MDNALNVHEIYLSLQGEGTRTGMPCILVRLAGCNLQCTWCDTLEARDPGSDTAMSLDEILAEVATLNCKRVEVTGGEPLLQCATATLLTRFCDAGYETLVETNGSLPIADIDPRVIRIIDIKCPSSGEAESFLPANVDALTPTDELKFVLAGRNDYDYARDAIAEHALLGRCEIIVSPVAGGLTPADLARWMLDDGLDVRLGLQLHKILWPDAEGGV